MMVKNRRQNKRLLRYCVCILLLAALLRLFSEPAVRALLRDKLSLSPAVCASLLIYCSSGSVVDAAMLEPVPAAVQTPAPPAAETAPAVQSSVPPEETEVTLDESPAAVPQRASFHLVSLYEPWDALTQTGFTQADADGISLGGNCTYPVDPNALLSSPFPITFSEEGPQVLIVHTHTCEAYTKEGTYAEDEPYRTRDPDYSVVRVGTEIADVLEANGISVLHDTTINDYPSYNGAYSRMRQIIQQDLEENPSICMVLDVHRDAVELEDGSAYGPTTVLDGETCAQILLVLGTDEGGLYHPDWQENLKVGLSLEALLNREAPSLARGISLRQERFNTHMTKGSMIVEVGATGNTITQAVAAAHRFGETLAGLIRTNTP